MPNDLNVAIIRLRLAMAGSATGSMGKSKLRDSSQFCAGAKVKFGTTGAKVKTLSGEEHEIDITPEMHLADFKLAVAAALGLDSHCIECLKLYTAGILLDSDTFDKNKQDAFEVDLVITSYWDLLAIGGKYREGHLFPPTPVKRYELVCRNTPAGYPYELFAISIVMTTTHTQEGASQIVKVEHRKLDPKSSDDLEDLKRHRWLIKPTRLKFELAPELENGKPGDFHQADITDLTSDGHFGRISCEKGRLISWPSQGAKGPLGKLEFDQFLCELICTGGSQ